MTIDERKALIGARMRGNYSEGFLPGADDERDYPPQTDNPTPMPAPDKPTPISLIKLRKRSSLKSVATEQEKLDVFNRLLRGK